MQQGAGAFCEYEDGNVAICVQSSGSGLAGCGTTMRVRENWRDGRDGRGLIWFNQTNETDQINKRDQPVLVLHALRSVAG